MWLKEDRGWERNIRDLLKKAYARVSMHTKLRYAGMSREDLIHIYKQSIRSKLEYCGVVFHGGLNFRQERSLERCKAVILPNDYESDEIACLKTGIEQLSIRT